MNTIAVLGFLFVGVFIGIAVMALVQTNRNGDEGDDDTARLDFLLRNELSLARVGKDQDRRWAVMTTEPHRIIGKVSDDPRDAIDSATAEFFFGDGKTNG